MIQSSVFRQAATRRNKWRQVFRQVFSKIAWNLLPYLAVPIGERGCVIAVIVQNFPQYLVAGNVKYRIENVFKRNLQPGCAFDFEVVFFPTLRGLV